MQDIVDKPFATITYTEAVDLLKKSKAKFEFPVEWGSDLQSEHERYLTEKEFNGTPLMVTDYPKDIKVSDCISSSVKNVCFVWGLFLRVETESGHHVLLCRICADVRYAESVPVHTTSHVVYDCSSPCLCVPVAVKEVCGPITLYTRLGYCGIYICLCGICIYLSAICLVYFWLQAFYMRLNDDGRTVAAMDMLVPRVGELMGGSQREERADVRPSLAPCLLLPSALPVPHFMPRKRAGTSSLYANLHYQGCKL